MLYINCLLPVLDVVIVVVVLVVLEMVVVVVDFGVILAGEGVELTKSKKLRVIF